MYDIQSIIDGEHRYRLGRICELAALRLEEVESHGNIAIDGVSIGLAHCGAAAPELEKAGAP
jgi:hypothetical protein